MERPEHKAWGSYVGAAALLGLLVLSFYWTPPSGPAFFGVYVADEWSLYLQRACWAMGIITLLGGVSRAQRIIPRRQIEQVFLILVSLLGMTLLFGARDLILLIVCFELMGIPLFILAALEKQDLPGARTQPAEAGMKFFVVGVVSTPIALLGASFLVGLSQSTDLLTIAKSTHGPLLSLGLMLLLAGMGYKIGVVPFHMWVPDTYQAAPTPFVAFLSTVPKLAGMAALSRIYLGAFATSRGIWVPAVLGLITATIVLGNLWALPQSNTKRLLGYSGIGHIGYLLMGLVPVSDGGLGMMLFYVVGYGVTNLGAFLVLEAVESQEGHGNITELNGLWKRSPWLAFSMLLFLLSLAGIPFVVGFWAKLYVFIAVWEAGYEWLVVLGALIAVLSLFYYLQLVRAMYMTKPERDVAVRVPFSLALAITLCLVFVVGIGAYPSPWLHAAQQAAQGFVTDALALTAR
jgi:NADH-quinone oxidoreductase subunit N